MNDVECCVKCWEEAKEHAARKGPHFPTEFSYRRVAEINHGRTMLAHGIRGPHRDDPYRL